MAYLKGVAQKIAVYAHNTSTDLPEIGDAANITARISKDGGTPAATNDVNPTEIAGTGFQGIYIFDMTAVEMDADLIVLDAASATANVVLEPLAIRTMLPFYDDGTATFDRTTDSLQAIRDAAATVQEVADASAGVLLATTIATYTSNTNFTLTDGSPDDDVYVDRLIVITDQSTAAQKAILVCSDYVASSKTINASTILPGGLTFTFAVGDIVHILASPRSLKDTSATVWANLLLGTRGFTVDSSTFSPTTTQFECSLIDAADDIFINQYIRFETGANLGLTFRVTDSQGNTANPNNKTLLTVTQMPEAPTNGDAGSVYGSGA